MPELPSLPAVADQPVSAVLLAYNDEAHAGAVVEDWARLFEDMGREYELIVVDDGSTDRTAEVVEAVAARRPSVKPVRRAEHRGHGAALRDGVAAATKPLLFYTTCDRRHDPGDFKGLLAEIDKVHVISGFRRWKPVPLPLRALGAAYRLVMRVVFGYPPEPLPGWLGGRAYAFRLLNRAVFAVRLRDVNCAFRLLRREVFARMPIQSDGAFVHAEVLAKANFLGCYMNDDVLVTYRPRPDADDDPGGWRKDFSRVLSHPNFRPAPPASEPETQAKDSAEPLADAAGSAVPPGPP